MIIKCIWVPFHIELFIFNWIWIFPQECYCNVCVEVVQVWACACQVGTRAASPMDRDTSPAVLAMTRHAAASRHTHISCAGSENTFYNHWLTLLLIYSKINWKIICHSFWSHDLKLEMPPKFTENILISCNFS